MSQPSESGGPPPAAAAAPAPPAPAPPAPASVWHGTGPELTIAAVAVVVTAAGGYAVAGWDGMAVVVIGAAAIGLFVLRTLLPQGIADAMKKAREKATAKPVSGYSHRRFVVQSSVQNRVFYDLELRPVLEHLLAARLSERHGVNLYQDPDAARRVFCKHRGDAVLWQWISPDAPREQAQSRRRGIPRHALLRIIERLEKL
ncbi:MAG TPA: hypothetical protein VGG16_00525 [Streptosporangiaceae bacterium]